MTEQKTPESEAFRLTHLLNITKGPDHFPIDVQELALEFSKHQPDPITLVQGDKYGSGFDGALISKKNNWAILYNQSVQSEGRKRFTIAHEFGHYLLHRTRQTQFQCAKDDIESGESSNQELEADKFASTLLMPLDDFRRQVEGKEVSFELLAHCADRYGVSLTAAALRWIEFTKERAILIASRDNFMFWAKSSDAAFKVGLFFSTRKQTIELLDTAAAHSANAALAISQRQSNLNLWFLNQPSVSITEMVFNAGQYDYLLTLLLIPDYERNYEEEPEEDAYEHIVRKL